MCCAHCVWNGLSFSSPPRSLLSFRAAFLAFVCADERDKSDIKTPSECVSLKVSIFLALFPMSFHFHCNFEKRGATVVRRGAVWRRDAVMANEPLVSPGSDDHRRPCLLKELGGQTSNADRLVSPYRFQFTPPTPPPPFSTEHHHHSRPLSLWYPSQLSLSLS